MGCQTHPQYVKLVEFFRPNSPFLLFFECRITSKRSSTSQGSPDLGPPSPPPLSALTGHSQFPHTVWGDSWAVFWGPGCRTVWEDAAPCCISTYLLYSALSCSLLRNSSTHMKCSPLEELLTVSYEIVIMVSLSKLMRKPLALGFRL